ncbi:restriction endonuclease [Streptomyces caniscabiei]|uniref:Restriction endonuclease n=1 Tax=Streptomyces caniscabiei TaxID=2746961 RepID=A0ABU4N3X9_9ACTN|nr:restriction endonuclease [Streptomyces caniscabiei]MBE4740508.1 restriction endonuclease [Streptomyces caniscabiei]MBE4761319.1 restriction endonuclease [Streptomyces caniscabiei]MBE4773470.1 restriction endonuclease [Streptomyces caniscabiei]MBE4790083.1 restriction endonuclease [Streptomyces caniscabiei]MDX2946876.1 restriction endonuclease [Streptomyces caniscabiei]
MDVIRTNGRAITERLTELVGYKAGLVVSEEDVARVLQRRVYVQLYPGTSLEKVLLRPTVFEILGRAALEGFGVTGSVSAMRPLAMSVQEQLNDQDLTIRAVAFTLAEVFDKPDNEARFVGLGDNAMKTQVPTIHVPPKRAGIITQKARTLHGAGMAHAVAVTLREMSLRISVSPFKWQRAVAWNDALTLAELFTSESTLATYGRFFDQRFVNYLASNYEEIGEINWRKFEAMTAEYFHRAGFEVELGAGRNDNGVDIRVWEKSADIRKVSPLTIIQCKREKRKIEKVVVKALAADVDWEGAKQGLLVATAEWSPGAREVVATRSYPVSEVNGEALQSWLIGMRETDAGLWLP